MSGWAGSAQLGAFLPGCCPARRAPRRDRFQAPGSEGQAPRVRGSGSEGQGSDFAGPGFGGPGSGGPGACFGGGGLQDHGCGLRRSGARFPTQGFEGPASALPAEFGPGHPCRNPPYWVKSTSLGLPFPCAAEGFPKPAGFSQTGAKSRHGSAGFSQSGAKSITTRRIFPKAEQQPRKRQSRHPRPDSRPRRSETVPHPTRRAIAQHRVPTARHGPGLTPVQLSIWATATAPAAAPPQTGARPRLQPGSAIDLVSGPGSGPDTGPDSDRPAPVPPQPPPGYRPRPPARPHPQLYRYSPGRASCS